MENYEVIDDGNYLIGKEPVYYQVPPNYPNWKLLGGYNGERVSDMKWRFSAIIIARKVDKPRFPSSRPYPYGY